MASESSRRPAPTTPCWSPRAVGSSATPRWYSLQFVTPFSLAWIATAVFVLIATGIGVHPSRDRRRAGLEARRTLVDRTVPRCGRGPSWPSSQQYPVPVPFWDQWDGEGVDPLHPMGRPRRDVASDVHVSQRASHLLQPPAGAHRARLQRAMGSAPADRRERDPPLVGGAGFRRRCSGSRWGDGISLASCSRSA